MTDTVHLGLPAIEASQAQKHVTHNEALRMLDALVMLSVKDRDLSAPPVSPVEGDRYIVKAVGSGAFVGKDDAVAHYCDGGWFFYPPRIGWLCFVEDEGALLAWDGAAWIDALNAIDISELQNLALLGVGTTADATNPLSAKLNNVLWTAKTVAEGGDGSLRYKMSKESAAQTLSVLFQDNFSGRAEIGLAGDDDFHFKTSPDGATWVDALVLDKTTGAAKFSSGLFLTGDVSPAQITANQNDYNPANLDTASVLRLSSDATRNVTGLAGGGDGRVLTLHNVGTNPIVLKDASSSSSAGNRFSFGFDVALAAKQSVTLWYDVTDARWRLVAWPQPVPRERLTANRTYYVRTDGSNSNDGLANTAGGAFLTIQKALDVVLGSLDLAGYNVTIQVADGTYAGAVNMASAQVGKGLITINGNSGTPANVLISVTGSDAVQASVPGARLHVQAVKIATTGNYCLAARNGAYVTWSNVNFGVAGFAQVAAFAASVAQATGAYVISASAPAHLWIEDGAVLIDLVTVTLSGTPAWTFGFVLGRNGKCSALLAAFSGSATGPRYSLAQGVVINTGGGGASYFPGNASGSGMTATFDGWYL